MNTDTIPPFPQGLKEFLEALALPCPPPLPLAHIGQFHQTAPRFFATDDRPVRFRLDSPDDLDILLDRRPFLRKGKDGSEPSPEGAAEPAAPYVACGLVGSGLQGIHFLYLLDVPGLRLGLSLPWGRAYGDAEEEVSNMEAGLRLAHICQRNIADCGRMHIFLGPNTCHWTFEDGDSLCQGDDANSLLDHLTINTASSSGEVPSHLWIRV